jgi:hypothetical protein
MVRHCTRIPLQDRYHVPLAFEPNVRLGRDMSTLTAVRPDFRLARQGEQRRRASGKKKSDAGILDYRWDGGGTMPFIRRYKANWP